MQQQGSPLSMIFIFIIFGLIFYFMIYRPQAKRNKAHKQLMAELSKGTKVLTSGGLVGRIVKITPDSDDIVIELNANTQVSIKRNFIVSILPKDQPISGL